MESFSSQGGFELAISYNIELIIYICPLSLSLSQLNRERVGSFVTGDEGGWRDVMVLGDCEEGVVKVCELCGWKEELGKMLGVQKEAMTSASQNTQYKCEHRH